jgi:long-chain acyl-CoA synthetase
MTPAEGRQTVVDRLTALFSVWGAEQAIQFETQWWTWGDVGRVHASLRTVLADRSVPDNVSIGIVMRQRPALVASELAVLGAGRTAVLLTPLQPDAALASDLVGLTTAVLIAHAIDWGRPGFSEAVQASGALGLEITDDFQIRVGADGDLVSAGDEIDESSGAAVTVMSSGTTGPAKRLPVAWETFVQLGGGRADLLQPNLMQPDLVRAGQPARSGRGAVILSLPLTTLGGLLSMSRLVFGGRPLSMMERFDVHTWAALVKHHRPKVIGAPPPVVSMILDANISPDHFEGVTAYMTSSAPLAPEVAAEFERRYGIPVLLGYGATEFLNSVTGWTGELFERFGPTKLGSVGRALPGVELRVVDGILEVDPPQRASGLPAGWLRTNDRARIDDDGFVWILGRADDVIIRGGFKVDLGQIEAALVAHPLVKEAFAVGLHDDRLGEVPGALVVAGTENRPTEAGLIEWLRKRLKPYEVPVRIRVVDEIPATTTLKRHRSEAQRLLIGRTEPNRQPRMET